MSIALRLDVPAVRNLIENDAEFSLELQRSVVAEVVRNVLLKDARQVLPLLQPAIYEELARTSNEDNWLRAALSKELEKLVTRVNAYWQPKAVAKVTPEFQAKIDGAVQPLIAGYIKQISDASAAQLAAAAAKAADGMEALIDKRVARLTTELIEREVDIKFRARLAALAAGGA